MLYNIKLTTLTLDKNRARDPLLTAKIHQYAKRQMTWFKRDQRIVWFDISRQDYVEQVAKKVTDWYNQEG